MLFKILYYIWHTGYWAGIGLLIFKYADYAMHKDYFFAYDDTKELYEHDHKWYMILRNWLFYCCLSWYGVYMFIARDE